jgi:threonine dehydrogenase-like Zn-dependent dehydrogenase
VWRGKRDVRIEQVADPELVNPHDAIVRVTLTAICGSDLHLYNGHVAMRSGDILGHEFVGKIVATGPACERVKVGDRVVVMCAIACGRCWFCRHDLWSACDNTSPTSARAALEHAYGHAGGALFGSSHVHGGYAGGQAEYVRVPFADVGPMKIPDDMSDEDVLFLSDILPTAYQAAEMGSIREGDTVVIFGAGPVGILTSRCAWLLGAGRVIVVDHLNYRLDFVRGFASVETVNYTEVDDIILHLKKMTGDPGPDVCIDAVGCEASGSAMHVAMGKYLKLEAGSAVTIEWCIDAVRKCGHVSIIGVYGPPWNVVPVGTAMNKGLTIRTNQCNVHRYMPHLLEHIRAGRLNPKDIISHRLTLEDAPYAYEIFAGKKDDCIKCVLMPSAAAA